MKIALIGHRGIGKSRLVAQLGEHFPDHQWLCLDQYLEEKLGTSITEYFKQNGEVSFRRQEELAWREIHQSCENYVVAVGAGYRGEVPPGVITVWLQRNVDASRWRFLDRPLWDGEMLIPRERFLVRQKRFGQIADYQLVIGEQLTVSPAELSFFTALLRDKKLAVPGFYWTPQSLKDFFAVRKIYQGPVEWRTDLLATADILACGQPQDLLSFRQPLAEQEFASLVKRFPRWDWDTQLGEAPRVPPISSSHQGVAELHEGHLQKLAVPVKDFSELIAGYRWWQADPAHRVFLPMSDNGRWNWFRNLQAENYQLNFFRFGQTAVNDQPTFGQRELWQSQQFFAAILGCPVNHSLTPAFHREFFNRLGMNVLAIEIGVEEWELAIEFLTELGLRAAAVTSPLKSKAGELVGQASPINTLVFTDLWHGTNTDEHGLRQATEKFADRPTAIWGGGGTLPSLQKVFTHSAAFSARTGQLKSGNGLLNPQVVVWAAPPNAANDGPMPPPTWRPDLIFDLNYTTDSLGIACAALYQCPYLNGLNMFIEQAKAQQTYWSHYVGK